MLKIASLLPLLLLTTLLGTAPEPRARALCPAPAPAPAPPPVVPRSLQIEGLVADTFVRGRVEVHVLASDPLGVESVRLFVDDVLVHTAHEGAVRYLWNTRGLEPGEHVIDAVALNRRGEAQHRRVRVLAGGVDRFARSATGEPVSVASTLGSGDVAGVLLLDEELPGAPRLATANARVELVDRLGRVVRAVRSTEAGVFHFPWVPAGHYRVRVNKRGFVSDEHAVHVAVGGERFVDVRLVRL